MAEIGVVVLCMDNVAVKLAVMAVVDGIAEEIGAVFESSYPQSCLRWWKRLRLLRS